MEKNRYYKTTAGIDQLSFVGKNVAYTTEADLKGFQANAPEGALGLFNVDTGLVLPASAAAAANIPIIVALKRGGATETSTPFYMGRTKVTKIPYEAPVKHAVTLTVVSTPTITVGDTWGITLFETTTANQPFPTWQYQYTVKSTDTTMTILLASIAAMINNQALPQNNGDRLVVATSTATTLVLTAVDFGRVFTPAIRQGAANAFSVAVTAQFKIGSGTPDQVLAYDAESNVKKGVTTNYPINGVPSEYGLPLNFVDTAVTYVTYAIVSGNEEDQSGTPVDKHFRKVYQFIFNANAGTANASIDAVLGVGPVIP